MRRRNLQALFCLITPKKGINIAKDCCQGFPVTENAIEMWPSASGK
jgi:hypothetical protein